MEKASKSTESMGFDGPFSRDMGSKSSSTIKDYDIQGLLVLFQDWSPLGYLRVWRRFPQIMSSVKEYEKAFSLQ